MRKKSVVKKDIRDIKEEVTDSLIERINNFLSEKTTFCLEKGLSPDQASFVLTKAIQNIFYMLPIKAP